MNIMTDRTRRHFLYIIIVVLVVFLPSLKNDFVWDDNYLIVDNPLIKDWRHLPELFSTHLYKGNDMHSNFYRPLQSISFMVDYHLWKMNPFGYHFTGLLLHIINAILVYLIVLSLSSLPVTALITGLLFGVAPAISGIVYYISARSDLLMGLSVFLSFLCLLRYQIKKRRIFYFFSVAFFLASLYCKEMSVGFFFVILSWIAVSRIARAEKIKLIVPYVVVLLFYVFLRVSLLNFSKGPNPLIDFGYPASVPFWHRIFTSVKLIPEYAGLLLFPYNLHMEWFIRPAESLLRPDIILSILFIASSAFLFVKASRTHRIVSFGATWFILTLLPVLNIYPISVFFGEGWLYVPSVGFFIIIAKFLTGPVRMKAGRKAMAASAVFLLIYYSFFTLSYGRVWKDSASVFENVLKYEQKNPFIYLTYNNLSMAYFDRHDLQKSASAAGKSIELKPDYEYPYNNLGVVHMTRGEFVNAIKCFKKAISLNREYLSAYQNLAYAYRDIGMTERAVFFLKNANKIDPYNPKIYCVLGEISLDKEDELRALEFFQKAKALNSGSHQPYYYLGSYYNKRGRFDDAIKEFERAEELGLRSFEFFNEMAFLYVKLKDFANAERAFRLSLNVNNEQPGVHNNLGNIYAMFGKFDEAISEYKQALLLDPSNAGIKENIIKTEEEKNNFN